MAKIIFKGVPDFTEVRAEIAKLKQEVASVSSTKVNLNGTAQGLNGAANAAGKLAGNLQKISTNPTAIQKQAEALTGISTASKSAADGATAFGEAFLNTSDKVQKGTKEMTEETNLLGDSFTNVYLKMLQWQVMGTIVSKTIGAFRDAISTMKAVDDEMVTVRKVTGFTAEQMEELRDRAYETASAYGEAADEYLNSVAAFARAGYGEQADALAELATKTKLVGDTNAETAQQFLLSVDAAYQYKGDIDALTKVLDGANEIDNKYATSIEKLAEGLGTVAPVAAQAHVGIDELTAAIGTITAVTQRSGSEAARAFRALVLNIVGDTKTEIDEGVTWTTGEIAGLKDVIRQYAPAAYEAAKATGEVIDPMEAIGGLAQSMKDGLLTEQKLMEMVSDIGGKLRTSQLLALIQNWDMYQSMLKDYANAVGSADKEIENALDSWTRKTNILKNEWAEFIQSMVSTDAVKGGLDVLIGAVEVLNTDIGHFAAVSGTAVLGMLALKAAAKGATAAFAKLSAAGIAMNPWLLAIAAAAGAFSLVWKATEDYRKSLSTLNTEIETDNTQLEENKKRLEEISEIPWHDLTPELIEEKKALEAENAELEQQIKHLTAIAEKKSQRVGGVGGTTITSMGSVKGYDEFVGRSFNSTEEMIAQLRLVTGQAISTTADLERLGITYETLADKAKAYTDQLQSGRSIQQDQINDFYAVKTAAEQQVAAYEEAIKANGKLTDAQQADYDVLKAFLAQVNKATQPMSDYVAGLLKVQRQAGKSGNQIYDLVKRMIVLNEKKLDLSQQIGALRQLATEAGAAAYSVGMIGAAKTQDVERTIKGLLQTGKAKTYDEARAIVLNRIYKSMFTDTGRDSGTVNTTSTVDTSSPTSPTGKSTKDAELERLKNIVSLRKSELSLMQERGDSTADQIDKMRQIQAALHAQAEYMRRIGASQADINALSTEHWKITKQIKELQEDLWDELEDAVNKKLEEAEDARDKQTAAIDKQIAALKDAKQAEDEALKLEQLKAAVLEKQNALLEAQKERTVRVFNAATGQWEWEANASSVKSAQDAYEKAKEDLADYERELALQREIDELEAKKKLIEETYDTLKAEWKRITDSLQEPTRTIDDILSDIARNGTPKMRQQVEEVNNLLGKLNQYIAGAMNGIMLPGQTMLPGMMGAAGATGGYHFDYTKNPGGGWTQTEMNEGFIPSGSSGWK